jgi:signal transduction histidine kinase/CHASE3 domain sensor protein
MRDNVRQLLPMKERTSEFLISGALFAVLLVICLNSWLALRSIGTLRDSEGWVSHTWQVLAGLEQIIGSAKDAETGSRGFLITGDDAYLEPYNDAVRQLPREIDAVKTLTADNPHQQARIPLVRAQIDARLQFLQQEIDARRAGQSDALHTMVASGTGKAEMDRLREAINAMQDEERLLLSQRVQTAHHAGPQAQITVLLASIFDVVMIGLAFWLLSRERGFRLRADQTTTRLEKLQSISDVGLTRLDTKGLTNALLERLRSVIKADGVVLCNWHDGEIEVMSGNGVTIQSGQRIQLSSDDPLYAAATGNLLVAAKGSEAQAIPLGGISTQMRAVLILPLTIGGRTAALLLAGRREEDAFSDGDHALLTVAADRISLALDRANAYEAERLARQAAEESAREVQLLNAELEDRVRLRTAELETTNRELEAFSYSVSHDLRAPLRSVDGFSLALEEDFRESLNAEGRDFIKRIRAGVQKMGQLIDSLLQLSRITRAEIAREDVNISELAEDVARDLRAQNPERALSFSVQPGLVVNADPKLLRVALENLLGNAVKFTANQPAAQIEFGRSDSTGAFYIRDNGAGFDMKYANKLFVAFQRLHGDKDFKGSGIGLATVSRVIRRHQGTIHAEGAVNNGATFSFTLG